MIRDWLNELGRRSSVRRSRDRRRWTLEALEGRTMLSTFAVTSLDGTGTGVGTLRNAIADADISAGSTIQFDVSGTITLASALPKLSANMTILGPGSSNLTIAGGGVSSIFGIFQVPSSSVTISISGLTLANGGITLSTTNEPGGGGGAISNLGAMALSDCVLSGDTATPGYGGDAGGGNNLAGGNGGAIYNLGTLTVDNCSFSGDMSGGGGAIGNFGTLTVNDSLFTGDKAFFAGSSANQNSGPGGGIDNRKTLTVLGSTFSGDSGSGGGGIYNGGTSATVSGCTLSGNSALNGGGIGTYGPMTVANCTIANNSATAGYGGGVNNYDVLTISDSTVSGNTAPKGGGGVYTQIGFGAIDSTTLNNTIIAGNTLADQTTPSDLDGEVNVNSQNNLIGTDTPATLTNGVNGNLVGVTNPGLGSLVSDGGTTQVIQLLAGSPAIDAGNNSLAINPVTNQPLTTDQRGVGFPRLVGTNVDIGAFEYSPPVVTGTQLAAGYQSGGSGVTSSPSPILVGTALPGAGVQFYSGSTLVASAVAGANGSFSASINSKLAAGSYSLVAVAYDSQGYGPASAPFALTVQPHTSAPAGVTFAAGYQAGSGGATGSPTPVLVGTAMPGAGVQVYSGSTLVATAVAGTNGAFSAGVTSPLAAGSYNLVAVAYDSRGYGASSPAFALTVQAHTSAPSGVGLASGYQAGGAGVTGSAIPILVGTTMPGAGVQIYSGSTLVATAVAGANGSFSASMKSPLAAGSYNLVAVAYDSRGYGTSAPAFALTVQAHTSAPMGIALASAYQSGGSGVTASAYPVLVGTAMPGAGVQIYSGSTLVATAVAGANGAFSATVTTALSAGNLALVAVAYDSRGYGASSPAFALTVQAHTSAPTGLALATASQSGGSGMTSSAYPMLVGTATPGAGVQIYSGTILVASGVVGANGTFSASVIDPLPPGSYSLVAVAYDSRGYGASSSAFALTINL